MATTRPLADAELIDRLSRPSDISGDMVDRAELQARLGLESPYIAGRILAQLDGDGDGLVPRVELLRRLVVLMDGPARDRLRFAFGMHDEDSNGYIDRVELLRMLDLSLAENRLMFGDAMVDDLTNAMFEHADENKDGKISFEEFARTAERYPGVFEQMTIGDLRWLGLGPGVAWRDSLDVRIAKALKGLRRQLGWILLVTAYAIANIALFTFAVLHYRELGANTAIQIARGCGACLNLHGALIFVPMMRRTWTLLGRTAIGRGLIDDQVAFHRLLGNVAFYFALGHGGAHIVNLVPMTPSRAMPIVLGWAFVTGALLIAVHGIMWLFARERIRRSGRFELFALTHRLWPLWVLLILVHGPVAWIWMVGPFSLYVIDRLLGRRIRKTVVRSADVLSSGVTRLTIDRPADFRFVAGDYAFVRLRALAAGEWHPFTISSPPERSDAITLHVRSSGNWTSRLHALARARRWDEPPLRIDIDGPYGTASAHVFESKAVMLVAAGIGVTPFASVLSSLLERYRRGIPTRVTRVHFVWVCREQHAFEWFADLLAQLERAAPHLFCIHIYMDAGRGDVRSSVLRVAMDALYARVRADLVTGLCARTTLGAPDWDKLISSIVREHGQVDAFYCGPPGLAAIVRGACNRHEVLFRQEHF